jgi:hypothetical protein
VYPAGEDTIDLQDMLSDCWMDGVEHRLPTLYPWPILAGNCLACGAGFQASGIGLQQKTHSTRLTADA